MKVFLCLLIVVLLGQSIFAQQTISGTVQVDKTFRTVPYASVNILSGNKIIAFKPTDKEGRFAVTLTKDYTNIYLQINHLTYEKFERKLGSQTSNLRIILLPKNNLLQDVVVKSKPKVTRSNDTISYDVGSFAKEEDRNIGDVIKRLPGMEVTESGLIKYQDKTVSKLYIDGDDLLENRYGIGTRTIPHKMVKDIQVLDNHEHYKVLKNKRFTDDVAINLVIKDEAKLKLTGQAKIAAGPPSLYDPELNSILFNKKVKMLNVLSGNSIGRDLSGDIIGDNQSSLLAKFGRSPVNNLLSTNTTGSPNIPKSNYYFNNTGSLNTNNLYNLKNHWQLKSNIQALYDNNRQNNASNTQYLLDDGDVYFNEQNHLKTARWLGTARLSASTNTEQQYASNALSLEYEKSDIRALLTNSSGQIDQFQKHHIKGFSNLFSYIPQLENNDIIAINWSLNYGNKPQSLQIYPGLFPEILNDNTAYKSILQHMEVPSFFTEISTGYRFNKGKFKQYYQIGVNIDRQHFNSLLSIDDEDHGIRTLGERMRNDLHWSRTQAFITPQYSWKTNRFETQLDIPVTYLFTHYEDISHQLSTSKNSVLINPNLKARWQVSQEDYFQFNYQFAQDIGNIEDIYRGAVLRNYRMLSQNNAALNESQKHSFNLNYNLARTLKVLFAHAGISYSRSLSNTILSSVIKKNITENILVNMDNLQERWSSQIGFDKYIFPLASTLKLKGSISYFKYNQLLNNALVPIRSISYQFQPSIEAKVFQSYHISYSGLFNWSWSKQQGLGNVIQNKTTTMMHNIGFPANPFQNGFMRVNIRNLATFQTDMKNASYTFIDFFARYKVNKWKMDFELEMNNLANIKNYRTYMMTANMISQHEFELRGRTVLLRTIFNL
ncbi:hypothetical protein [Sphingobacterium sp. 2149]|uniref:hypothetical protein n=1 Tax=Sphingobacterium sp. 2149 TaxID=2817763 RepID=UPI001AE9AE7A|nr:hypothetical protein [Sphingobacterium sp. 2149]MDR6737431.1 hypothetical protein [Sphingobacterium sp. 2149]